MVRSIIVFLVVLALGSQAYAIAKTEETASQKSDWPRQLSIDNQKVIIYQPEVESLKNNKLEERAAIEIDNGISGQPVFGVMWITARTEIDKSSRIVNLEDFSISKLSFPTAKEKEKSLLPLLQKEVPDVMNSISLDRLDSSLSISQIESQKRVSEVKSDPPRIIYDSVPSVLVLIDGEPVERNSGVPNILRVINTRALILFDQGSDMYYYLLGKRWLKSSSLKGSWKLSQPSGTLLNSLEKAKKIAVDDNQVELAKDSENNKVVPKMHVSTEPAELVVTNGKPQLEPIPNTQILYVKNTVSDLFLDTNDQNYYLMLTGRWYHSKSLDGGWSYVTPNSLPKDFSKISDNHPKGSILASVAGTPQAQEAAISNSIPQTAKIDRKTATTDIKYDGAPEFIPIEGTPLKYAKNSPLPVIEVDPHSFYSVKNGVWFTSSNPKGPWIVADKVPSVIYTIPASSPLYYVTYVYVYESTPEYVYTGYLPGYLGSYLTPDGVVVYGTGYIYQPWIGSVWYGPPVTFGLGIGWGYGFGWNFFFGYYGGFFGGSPYRPWWGPWHGNFAHRNPVVNQFNINHTNVYRNWGRNVVRSKWIDHRPVSDRFTAPARSNAIRSFSTTSGHTNNIYSDHDGNIYRQNNREWQRYGSSGWQSPARDLKTSVPVHELEQERSGRAVGQMRTDYFRSSERAPSFREPSSHGMGQGFRSMGGSRRR